MMYDLLQVWGTCLGHQLQMILTANVDFNDLLITTDAVVSAAACLHTCQLLSMQALSSMRKQCPHHS